MCFNPENVPPGWGFHPTDQQLLSYYSNLKDLLTHPNPEFDIKLITLSEYDPWDLFDKFKNNSGGKEMYFFTPREYYRKTKLRKRTAGSGHWKCTGDPRYITREDGDDVIGEKRSLVFHNPLPTQFIITEYEKLNLPAKGEYVLCKLKIKNRSKKAKPDIKNSRPKKKARIAKFLDANRDSKQMVAKSAVGEGKPSNRMASYEEKQYLNYEIPICDVADELITQSPNVDEIPKNRSFSRNDCYSLSNIDVTDDLFGASLSKNVRVSAYDKDEFSSEYLLDDPYEKIESSTFDKAESISNLEYHKNEDCYRKGSCFGDENVNENADTSDLVKGEGYPCKKSPDFDTQNRLQEKDVSFPDNYFSLVNPLHEENEIFRCHKEFEDTHGFPTFAEINIQQELEWLEEFLEVKDSNEAPELGGNFRALFLETGRFSDSFSDLLRFYAVLNNGTVLFRFGSRL
ncbi:NAC domain containing protein 2 [Euphorbia peplus]|nr:NAC domain containing protein 2 [Euphorbia peplus]